MNPRSIRTVLWSVSGACVLAAVGAPIAALLTPVERDIGVAGMASSAVDLGAPSAAGVFPPLEAFAVIWEKGAPVAMAEPVEPAPVLTAPVDSIPVRLLGTAVEKGRSAAVLADDQDRVHVRTEGESVEGVRVIHIAPSEIEIEYQGKRALLELPLNSGMTDAEAGAASLPMEQDMYSAHGASSKYVVPMPGETPYR